MSSSETPRTLDRKDVVEQLLLYQAMLHKNNLEMKIIQWEGGKLLYSPTSHYAQLREVIKTIPKFWYYALKNSGYLDIVFANQNDEKILESLIDINVDSMKQILDGKNVVDVMDTSYRVVYLFKENEYLQSKEIFQTVYFTTTQNRPVRYENSPVIFKNGFDVHIVNNHYHHSFFDQFLIPYESLNEEEKSDALANLHIILFDILKNPVHFFKGTMGQYEPKEEEILHNLEMEQEMDERRTQLLNEQQTTNTHAEEKTNNEQEIITSQIKEEEKQEQTQKETKEEVSLQEKEMNDVSEKNNDEQMKQDPQPSNIIPIKKVEDKTIPQVLNTQPIKEEKNELIKNTIYQEIKVEEKILSKETKSEPQK
ncbi:hypothetical protein ENUP19_0102G0034 [Entamoeba nuttalli]|uniref:Nucleosome assembly protein, putative n=2 Tax=Entamoeba nuttalli TaxID=412467 RepID=K2GCG4_ENTNP|nr:nucleosome assembly protein, putative [Entamoeba nuttalli P19]EKE40221.1 nucleosome assembly protein, putative [Entamoeba nuttalli P19]|eukprot:XP_008857452.1 nucleosome assembly protein, putative [Entamoeba nuttalli P19]